MHWPASCQWSVRHSPLHLQSPPASSAPNSSPPSLHPSCAISNVGLDRWSLATAPPSFFYSLFYLVLTQLTFSSSYLRLHPTPSRHPHRACAACPHTLSPRRFRSWVLSSSPLSLLPSCRPLRTAALHSLAPLGSRISLSRRSLHRFLLSSLSLTHCTIQHLPLAPLSHLSESQYYVLDSSTPCSSLVRIIQSFILHRLSCSAAFFPVLTCLRPSLFISQSPRRASPQYCRGELVLTEVGERVMGR